MRARHRRVDGAITVAQILAENPAATSMAGRRWPTQVTPTRTDTVSLPRIIFTAGVAL